MNSFRKSAYMMRFQVMVKRPGMRMVAAACIGAGGLGFYTSVAAEVAPLPSGGVGAGSGELMQMTVTDQQIIPLAKLRRAAIADPTVADLVPVRGGVLVVAKKAGTTKLSLWDGSNNTPRVFRIQVASALTSAVLPSTGGKIGVYGDAALLEGHMATTIEHQSALAAAQQSTGAGLSGAASSNAPGGNGSPAAGGNNGNGGASGGGAGAAASSGGVIDQSLVGTAGVVQVDVKIVQFNKSVLKEAGFNLFSTRSNGFGFGVFGATSLSSYTPSSTGVSFGSTVSTAMSTAFNLVGGPFGNGLFANLSVLETNGLARVLAEPTLVALSGQSASFLAGGEIPVPQSGGLGTTTIEYKSFGVGLSVTPTILGPKRIGLKVAPEASELDYANALVINGTSIPALTTRRADTTVELGDGESFVIGGLVSRNTIASVNKVPFLGDLPIIGAFFKSLSYSQSDSELVIVVTPHLVKPIARGIALPLPGAGRDSTKQPVWGTFLGGPLTGGDMPGFSR